MIIARNINKVRKIIKPEKRKGKTIGFVPTMGALHKGHLSLVETARKQTDFLVVSIFVNPLQFSPNEDFRQYPRNFNKDEMRLKKAKVDLLFYPDNKTMYPQGYSTYVEETYLSRVLCGKSRPSHFRGVTTVVNKLFNIIGPDIAYFGKKDYQQARIIEKMAADLNLPVKIKLFPIIREKDGLAMSSRNVHLTPQQRSDALSLFQSIKLAKKLVQTGKKDTAIIKKKIRQLVNSKKSVKIDYIEISDPKTLRPVKKIKTKAFLGLAVNIGKTRLIDNTILNSKKKRK